jgi:hypothetical protein
MFRDWSLPVVELNTLVSKFLGVDIFIGFTFSTFITELIKFGKIDFT